MMAVIIVMVTKNIEAYIFIARERERKRKREKVKMEDCLEGPHLGNHETQLVTRKWRSHEQP